MRPRARPSISGLLGHTAGAALGLVALVGSASASTFTYSSYTVVNEVNVHIGGSGPPGYETGYFGSGQIDLIGSGLDAGKTLAVWCIDATHILQWSDTYTIISSGFNDSGGASTGNLLSHTVLGEIGALVDWGDANINANRINSAAVQLAIWTIEYPHGTFISDSSAVNNLVLTLVTEAENGTLHPNFNLREVVDAVDNQGLVYLASTPLPATWTLMLVGLAGFGFFGYRRRRCAVTA